MIFLEVLMLLEMTGSDRFQLSLDLGGKGYEDLRRRYEKAMRETRRERPELLRVILEDWLASYEKHVPIRPLAPMDEPDPPEPRPRSGERSAFKRGSR